MKTIILALLTAVLFSCVSNYSTDKKAVLTSTDYLLVENSIGKLVEANHLKLNGIKGDLHSFKGYLNKLPNDRLTSIPFALDYIQTCISPDNADRDSIFLLFNIKFYKVVNRFNDSLETKYHAVFQQLNSGTNSVEVKNFENNLKACGTNIFISEGMNYIDVLPDFFYHNFHNRVSAGVIEFLNIRKDELKQGFSEDAGMLISFEDLYARVKRWENFIVKNPNTVYSVEANSYYTIYLETLMTGMDNSRIFDTENNSLLPEIKKLYQKIAAENTKSPTSKIIASYYAFLARHDFKENDSIPVFLEQNKLSTMLAVQPHTR